MPEHYSLHSIGREIDPLAEYLQRLNEQVENLGGTMDEARQRITRNTTQINSVIESLTEGMSGIKTEISNVATSLNQLSSAFGRNRQAIHQDAATIDDMWEAYRKMGVEVRKLGVDLDTLSFTEKEINKVVQLGTEYNTQRIDSYTALSQKYRAVKILIDQMTVSERENTEQGRALVASARDMYEQMNILQQRTGKYQLQVGNYSKAMTGLNIATQQVVRELPVLANGAAMFAIAISNNIPILLDNIVAVKRSNDALIAHKKELLDNAAAAQAMGDSQKAANLTLEASSIKTMSVVKGLASSLFSWQTAIVVLLSVLPGIIRKIQEKKKATEEASGATKEAIKYENLLKDAYVARDKEEVRSVATLQTLYHITQDANRADNERIKAAKALKNEFADEFANFSEEQIVMGNAITTYNNLTDSLYKMAKARAYQNKITEQWEKYIDQKTIADAAKLERDSANESLASARAALESAKARGVEGDELADYASAVFKAYQAQEKANAAFIAADAPLQDIDNAILKLRNDMPVDGLLAELLNGRKNGGDGDSKWSITDYYFQVLEASAKALEDGLDKDLALLEVAWWKERSGLQENLAKLYELREGANKEQRAQIIQQTEYVLELLRIGEKEYQKEYRRLLRERVESYAEEVNEEDVVQKEMDTISAGLKAEKKLRDMAAYEQFEQSKQTAADKEALNKALADSERQYWENYLADLREAGILTIDEYNKIMAQLAKATRDGEDKMSRGRRGRKYGGIVEALLAQTSQYGEGNKFGQGVIKEEYANFVNAIDNALKESMKYMDEWMQKRMEMAQIAVESAEREVEAARTVYEYELEARANGFANKADTARKELDLARQNHKKALDEERRLEEAQLAIDAAKQMSSLVTATANIWAAMTAGTGVLGPVLATAATALMWGSFAAAQVMAARATKSKSEQYGDGTVELLDGGSHASGHDIDLGTKKDGTRRRAEGGEFFAVINKRNSRKYRNTIPDVINAFNDGTFADKYQRTNQAMGNFALGLLTGNSPTDVSTLEREVRMIREQGEENRYVDSNGNQVVRYKNLTRKITRR